MAVTTMVYILPMLLGRTFNETSSRVGIDIFPQSAIDQAKVIPRQFSTAEYKVIKTVQDARNFLDVSGELSLRVKAGLLDIRGTGSYLKDSSSREEYIEILAKSHFESMTTTLRSSSRPNRDWFLQSPRLLGTHYVRSITYGGDLIASIRFKVKNSQDKERIAATIDGSFKKGGGALQIDLKGKFEKLQNELKSSTSLEIKYYATVNLEVFPTTIDELINLAKNFPNQVKQTNGGKGIPIRAELVSLTQFKDNYPDFLKNVALETSLNDLENKFDDVRSAIHQLDAWSVELRGLSPSQERRIGELNTKLQTLLNIFVDVIANMDISIKGSRQQFKPALDMYLSGGFNLPGKYSAMFRRLKTEIEGELFDTAQDCSRGFTKIENRLLKMSRALYSIRNNVNSLARCRELCRRERRCKSLTFMQNWSKYVPRRNQWVSQSNRCYINRVTSLEVPGYDPPSWMRGRFFIMDRC